MAWLYTKYVTLSGSPLDLRKVLCPHCRRRLNELGVKRDTLVTDAGLVYDNDATLATCGLCGWWLIALNYHEILVDLEYYSHLHSVLETCDVSTVDGTADELQRYLLHHYDQRFYVQPCVFEDVVGQVFRNHGYHVEATARSSDGGIDLIVGERSGLRKAVQVKRYKSKIEAALIREFAGALMFNGTTTGIFVTTSSFTTGAVKAAERGPALQVPIRIELMDAERFYSAMSFRETPVYSDTEDPSAPFYKAWVDYLRSYELAPG